MARPSLVAATFCLLATVTIPAAQALEAPSPASLGRSIFHDASLSASGQMSCASCHVPARAHAQSNTLAVQAGGSNLDVAGFRAVPSLRYLNFDRPFFFEKDGTPTGGFNRDGRTDDLIEQARRPFLAPHEMANADAASVAEKLSHASYADDFRQVFGADIFADVETTFLAAVFSVASFESTAPELRPFTSKFDLFLHGRLILSTQELRGFALFNRPDKGNCAGCHPSTRQTDGSPPVFTDYTYDNLGVPRNPEIAANADPGYFDLGLCGPDRIDLAERRDLCGQFKVPTLRNVATRQVWFHNGYFHSLKEALHFYVERDTHPERWYPVDAAGVPDKFDDLPAPLRRNVNTQEPPYDRRPGQAPRLNDAEIDDVIAFLNTLTDGYDAATGTADPGRDAVSP
jgi:cytochrome c peroxidase